MPPKPSLVVICLSVVLCLFTLNEVVFPGLEPQAQLAIFVMLGMVLCFLGYPTKTKLAPPSVAKGIDILLIIGAVGCCGYVAVQSIEFFEPLWLAPAGSVDQIGKSLGDRASGERPIDYVVGIIGILLVLESTRRSIGIIVPCLAVIFMLHAYYNYISQPARLDLPPPPLPNAGLPINDISAYVFLQKGVFGTAAGVMFKFVFLFVIFGSFLELSGATKFIVTFSERIFGRVTGGPAMVSVLGSALMGTLSGSAVANAVTTGNFTIPMMRRSGFKPHIAGGITAAAASGGALVPPVMGAGAYMMLELIEGLNDFFVIAVAAMIPAILYYLSVLTIVYLHARRIQPEEEKQAPKQGLGEMLRDMLQQAVKSAFQFDGAVFFSSLAVLIYMLYLRYSAFLAVATSLVVILLFTIFRRELELSKSSRVLALIVFVISGICFGFFGTQIAASAGIIVWGVGSLTVKGVLRQVPVAATLVAVVSVIAGLIYAGSYEGGLSAFFAACSSRLSNVLSNGLQPDDITLVIRSFVAGLFGTLLFALFDPDWRPYIVESLVKSARNGTSLITASACVGIIIGIVSGTSLAADLSFEIKQIVSSSLLLALFGIMCCSLVLGMGVPSVVCYLLLATLMGKLLEQLGVAPLAAHLFIFYFGMMSMVTPPVALAAYASASIAEAKIMPTALAAFRFALVGFTLPYMFIYRPALLLLPESGEETVQAINVAVAVGAAVFGIVALAAGIAGQLKTTLSTPVRVLMFASAACLLLPDLKFGDFDSIGPLSLGVAVNLIGAIVFIALAAMDFMKRDAKAIAGGA